MAAGEYVEMRVLRWASPVEVLRSRYTTFEFPTHAHAEFMVGEVLQGSELFAHQGKEVEAASGWFIHLNPSEAHTGRAARGSWTYVSLYPGMDLLRLALPELFAAGEPGFAQPVSRRPAMQGRLAAFVRQAFDGADDLALQSELFDILRELLAPPSRRLASRTLERSARSAAITTVRDRLTDEWDRSLSLIELAESVSLTPLALLRSFRDQVGCTPQVFRTARRIECARRLLRGKDDLVAVALKCGFSDQSHFTNTFRRWTGITPGQYRTFSRTT